MEELSKNIYKLNVDSNVYFLDLDEKIIIDTGPPGYREEIKTQLSKIIDTQKIQKVIFTHLHYDHIANFDLFSNAEFFASEEEIDFFKNNKIGAVLNPEIVSKFDVSLKVLKELKGFDIIKTPGHTKGSICLFYKKDKILFSGDTLFFNGYGRLDLPSSVPQRMESSLKKLKEIDYKILAPGHDY